MFGCTGCPITSAVGDVMKGQRVDHRLGRIQPATNLKENVKMLVRAEGTSFQYIPKSEGLEVAKRTFPNLGEEQWRLAIEADIRLGFFQNFLSSAEQLPYWLVWQDDADLDVLDEKVREGIFDDNDFIYAFRTRLCKTICMRGCDRTFHTLVMEGGDPYPSAFDLSHEKFARLKYLMCPNCGVSLGQAVAKIIGPADELVTK